MRVPRQTGSGEVGMGTSLGMEALDPTAPPKGLVPRAKLLLSVGGTFFLAFGPLIIVTVSLFAGLYLYFGQSFVHDGSKKPVAPPPYIDPYELLEDDRISRPSLDVF
ncbi:unnamed protein product [Triticum turgidum subsp. durum]|uniref:Uncharacterized protein n=1 Tax=Triticum turgidum subsp. durum TaxID=4567 RepID=A0A9R0T2M4_TRITD|nr:unnamed protein product [Triticum turgidum subsp. durum]